MKVVVRAIDRDPSLISRFLKDKPINSQEEEAKNNANEVRSSLKGLIPLLFTRMEKHVPQRCFAYNELLDLIKAICIQNDAKSFV